MDTTRHAGRSLRSEEAYRELKRRLLVGDFPLNVRLGEERLAEILGVSRTPIREAMLRLHGEGLVQRGADGGYEPIAPDVSVARSLYEVRSGLELMALRRPGRHGRTHDRTLVRELREDWLSIAADPPTDADPAFVLLDESFHITLAEAAGNPALADLLRQVNERIRLVRMLDFLTVERMLLTIDEHIGIVDAVAHGAIGLAETRFLAHLDHSVAVVGERVNRAIASMLTGGGR